MTSLLTGLRVIELTTMITGPLAGMMLADFGADVIKIENPNGGDPFRSFRGGLYSPHFCSYNRNKRSVALDLQSKDGKTALEALLSRSDVLIENFRPGVLDRLGFADDFVVDLNERLIRCHITGFGPTGPYAMRPAYDAVAQAISGMSSLFLEQQNPKISGPTIADNVTGQYACNAILAALFERERTGLGRRIDVNMLEATIAFMPDPFAYYTQMGLVSDPQLRTRTSQSYAFCCSDGKIIVVHLSSREKFWLQFVETIERPELLNDARMSTRTLRIENYDVIHGLAASVFKREPRAYWMEKLGSQDIPFAPAYDVTEVPSDPQVQHLDSFFELHHGTMGPMKSIRRPSYFDNTRSDQPAVAPPMLGEHTEEVLGQLGLILGCVDEFNQALAGSEADD